MVPEGETMKAGSRYLERESERSLLNCTEDTGKKKRKQDKALDRQSPPQ